MLYLLNNSYGSFCAANWGDKLAKGDQESIQTVRKFQPNKKFENLTNYQFKNKNAFLFNSNFF